MTEHFVIHIHDNLYRIFLFFVIFTSKQAVETPFPRQAMSTLPHLPDIGGGVGEGSPMLLDQFDDFDLVADIKDDDWNSLITDLNVRSLTKNILH